MTPTTPSRKQKQKVNAVVVAVCLAAIVGWQMAHRDGVERLPITYGVRDVYHGMVYFDWRDDKRSSGMFARLPAGGPMKTYYSRSGDFALAAPSWIPYTSAGKVRYIERPQTSGTVTVPTASDSLPPAVLRLTSAGEFAVDDSQAPRSDVRRTRARLQSRFSGELSAPLTVYSCDLPDGTARPVTSVKATESTIVGDTLFWVKDNPDKIREAYTGSLRWTEAGGHSELWATSLVDKSSRLIASRLSVNTKLTPARHGVFWTQRNPYPDVSVSLGYCSEAGEHPVIIKNYTGNMETMDVRDYPGGVLWFASKDTLQPVIGPTPPPDRIVMVNLDGSNRRTAPLTSPHEVATGGKNYPEDDLYTIIRAKDSPIPTELLCRIHPERGNTFEGITELPRGSSFIAVSDGYVYFHLNRKEYSSLWNQVTGDVTDLKMVTSFCRKRL